MSTQLSSSSGGGNRNYMATASIPGNNSNSSSGGGIHDSSMIEPESSAQLNELLAKKSKEEEDEEDAIINGTRRYQPGDPIDPIDLNRSQEDRNKNDENYVSFQDEEDSGDDDDDDDEEDSPALSIQELLYSSSSYYAIAKPVCLTMILAALTVVYINTDQTREQGQAAMASAYQVFDTQDETNNNKGEALALSLVNALIMICVIGTMTFVIVFLYRMRFMKCLIGYMIFCSMSLLGVLGANLLQTALHIYAIPIDQFTFYLFMFNFAAVGVLAVFWGNGIPRFVAQGYLIATSVILAWHLSFFDDWTAWCLLFMLALYDLCAVLSSVGPLRALVEAMSEEDAPDMPGLLFEAELPPEAKKPGSATNKSNKRTKDNKGDEQQPLNDPAAAAAAATTPKISNGLQPQTNDDEINNINNKDATDGDVDGLDPVVTIPLAIAQVYRLPVVSIPPESRAILYPRNSNSSGNGTSLGSEPLLVTSSLDGSPLTTLPENPNAAQLRADVTVRMPAQGGRLERVKKRGRRAYLERDRHGHPKRILWVDRLSGKVFAELRGDDDDNNSVSDPANASIRLGLGDFIFYSVLVSKAAQYSFATFAACTLVILAGLGGTLLLLAMYHQALPALPISILLGIVTYLLTRAWMEPWIEAILSEPYYV